MFWSEFYSISSGKYFGLVEHPSREAAEKYATTELIGFGESELDARAAAAMANFSCADASAHGYGVRIFEKEG
jgi:hypothetical protein